MARGIFEAYLAGEATGFYPAHFSDRTARRAAVAGAKRPLRPEVIQALERQNQALGSSPARARHLEHLRTGAAAVVTGQQVGLFLGPLYTLYKAMTAISAARILSQETGEPVVPIFWLQSEDHDLPESSTVTCATPGDPEGDRAVLSLPARLDDRVSLAHLALPGELELCYQRLQRALADLPFAGEHLALLRRHYRVGVGFVAAFAGLLSELCHESGLVFLNPRDPALASEALKLHREALSSANRISSLLEGRGRALEAAGFEPAVHVRTGAPLSFFHPDGPEGPRFRLQPVAEGFELVGRAAPPIDQTTLMARLESDPMSFSTSALLRPIFEAQLLPTAMYVGGPAEVAYLSQVMPLYEHFGRVAPVVLPRARLFVVEPQVGRWLEDAGLQVNDVASGEDALLARGRPRAENALSSQLRTELLHPTLVELERHRDAVRALGPGLERAHTRTRASIERALERFVGKVERAELDRDQASVTRLRRIADALYPGGTPQERVFGFSRYGARFGDRHFLAAIEHAFDPFAPRIGEVRP